MPLVTDLRFYLAAAKIVLYKLFCGWRQAAPVEWREAKALCLGLDGAGKTALLWRAGEVGGALKPEVGVGRGPPLEPSEPTVGFNVRSFMVPPDVKLEVWDLGGGSAVRKYWGRYVTYDVAALVWVVDASQPERFAESRDELKALLLTQTLLRGLPLLLLCSRADCPGAASASDVAEALGLPELQKIARSVHAEAVSASDGRGLAEALTWLTRELTPQESETTTRA